LRNYRVSVIFRAKLIHFEQAHGIVVCLNRLGEIRDRSYEDQRYCASALNLVVAAIILWNAIYLAEAVEILKQQGVTVNKELLQHLSPPRLEKH
jgi:TnpA family transposase